MAIEMPEEKSLRAEVQELRERFLQDHRCMQESKLDDLLRKVLSTDRRGVSVLDVNSEEYHYDFMSSLFFVIFTLSTTGEAYGLSRNPFTVDNLNLEGLDKWNYHLVFTDPILHLVFTDPQVSWVEGKGLFFDMRVDSCKCIG